MERNRLAYLSTVRALLEELGDEEDAMMLAAQWCADAITGGGLVHVFGAGHSHMAAEEAFYRAGGLVPVNAVLVDWLMLHQGSRRASLLERQPGLGELIVSTEPVEAGDVFFVVSNSGRNPVPVEVAEAAKSRGAKVVALTSRQHSAAVAARGGRGVKLADIADLVID
ncbi:MAG TPA: sugar isomerase domain-containing protein, partial [Acidimicrobiales bacterium]|nr:sugar isomerase domain-containing protein [Acidimicrobiales bacterium]